MIPIRIIRKLYDAPKAFFSVIAKSCRFLCMDLLNLRSHCKLILLNGIGKQPLTFFNPSAGRIVLYFMDRSLEFPPDFLIWDANRFVLWIIGEIPEMDQECENVVFTLEGGQVIGESGCIHLNLHSANEFRDRFRQTIVIPADIVHEAFSRRCFRPVGIEIVIFDCLHYGIRIVYRPYIFKCISVIPELHCFKVNAMPPAKIWNLIFRKSDKLPILPGFDHRVFPEIWYCWLGAILLDREDSRHIGSRDCFGRKCAVFEPFSEEIQISFLCGCILFCLTDHRIPLINDKNEFPAVLSASHKKVAYGIPFKRNKSFLHQILPDCFFDHSRNFS